jgi:hypothetical protein
MRPIALYSPALVLIFAVGCQQQRSGDQEQDLTNGALDRYAKELVRSQNVFSDELVESKVEPAKFVVGKLSQEPSGASRHYADALNLALVHRKSSVARLNIPGRRGGPLDAAQEARIDALTHMLLTHLPEGDSAQMFDLRWEMLKAVATECPTGGIVDILSNLPSDLGRERRGEMCRLVFARLLDESHPPSASLVSHLLALRIAGYGVFNAYGHTLVGPRGTELSGLLRRIDSQIKRQIDVDRAAIITHMFSSRSRAAEFRKAVDVLDRNLVALKEDRRKLAEFFDALWNNDSGQVVRFVNGDLAQNWAQLRGRIFKPNATSFQIESITANSSEDQLHITLKVFYLGEFRYEQFSFVVDRSRGWHLTKVSDILL